MSAHAPNPQAMPIDNPSRDALVSIRPRVLAKREAAKYIGCGLTKIDELIGAQKIAAKRISKTKVVVFVDSLDAYLDALPNAREAKQQ
ncbi:MAG: hypothetical protein ACR652_00640 [Methylocystis sp.]|uniref:hypothetical protein n=1 Tax=Methylocystis sp. TaxID=1911079 RepID=UPI003DA2756E